MNRIMELGTGIGQAPTVILKIFFFSLPSVASDLFSTYLCVLLMFEIQC